MNVLPEVFFNTFRNKKKNFDVKKWAHNFFTIFISFSNFGIRINQKYLLVSEEKVHKGHRILKVEREDNLDNFPK